VRHLFRRRRVLDNALNGAEQTSDFWKSSAPTNDRMWLFAISPVRWTKVRFAHLIFMSRQSALAH
jgi:hypothetical protein